jgi:hypothetical protein
MLYSCFSLIMFVSKAQVDYPDSKDDKNTPKIKYKGEIGDKDLASLPIKACIKFEPSLLFRGIFAFGYEREIVHNLTLQGTAGISIDKDFCQTSNVIPIEIDRTAANEVSIGNILSNGQSGKTGYYISGDAKIYFSNDIFNDGYFGAKLTHYMYNLTYRAGTTLNQRLSSYNTANAYIPNDINMNVYNSSFSIFGGVQFSTKGTIKTTHDFYLGIGLNLISYKKFILETSSQVGSPPNVILGTATTGKTVFISFGYAVGIGF